MKVPLNRALSKLGILSRSRAADAIRAGRVSVDGRIVTDPAALVVPERMRVAVDGTAPARTEWRTILLHKPRGAVTTRSDPEGRRTVFDVVGAAAAGLQAVGRLDLATSGLLLLTSDTQLANWITDPTNAVRRVYVVTVRGEVGRETIEKLGPGVALRKASKRESHVTVELTEGRNRQVRRMFESVGHEVTRLKRIELGGLGLGVLAPGEWMDLTRDDMRRAFEGLPMRTKASASTGKTSSGRR